MACGSAEISRAAMTPELTWEGSARTIQFVHRWHARSNGPYAIAVHASNRAISRLPPPTRARGLDESARSFRQARPIVSIVIEGWCGLLIGIPEVRKGGRIGRAIPMRGAAFIHRPPHRRCRRLSPIHFVMGHVDLLAIHEPATSTRCANVPIRSGIVSVFRSSQLTPVRKLRPCFAASSATCPGRHDLQGDGGGFHSADQARSLSASTRERPSVSMVMPR